MAIGLVSVFIHTLCRHLKTNGKYRLLLGIKLHKTISVASILSGEVTLAENSKLWCFGPSG